MCDYSLQNVRSRPAKVGDKLTTRDFGTVTRGFAAVEDVGVGGLRSSRNLSSAIGERGGSCTSPLHRVEGGKTRPYDGSLRQAQ